VFIFESVKYGIVLFMFELRERERE